jgi:hypothetical protein
MRNPERIKYVLRELERLWNMHPDWRLGQLIFNIPGRDPFYIEDDDLIKLGFQKFGRDETPEMKDWPEYYVGPNPWDNLPSVDEIMEKIAEDKRKSTIWR